MITDDIFKIIMSHLILCKNCKKIYLKSNIYYNIFRKYYLCKFCYKHANTFPYNNSKLNY